MFVNLTDVLTNEDRVVSMQAEAQIGEVSVGGEKYPVSASSPVSFVFSNTGKGRARIEGKAAFVFSAGCDRCLKPVREKLRLQFSREVHAPDAVSEQQDDEDDDQCVWHFKCFFCFWFHKFLSSSSWSCRAGDSPLPNQRFLA